MTGELYALIFSILFGVGAVLLWGVFDVLRTILKNTFWDFIFDVCWWVLAASSFCVCMWHTVNMELRAFEFFGIVIGAVFGGFLLLKPVKRIFTIILGGILKIIQFILKILLTPCVFLYKILVVRIIGVLCSKRRKVANNDTPEGDSC